MTSRKNIYYWKCDRPSAFYAIQKNNLRTPEDPQAHLFSILTDIFGLENFVVRPAGGQGNHLTFLAEGNDRTFFIRAENGPEKDDYMEVEGRVIDEVWKLGVPVPRIFAVDTTRSEVPFAYQVMEFIDYPDLNSLHKKKELDLLKIAGDIGGNLANWQSMRLTGYGPFNVDTLRTESKLEGLHKQYETYFFLNLDKHLNFLASRNFLTRKEAGELLAVIESNRGHLRLKEGCLVHKDLALWNLLGENDKIKAFIDWDDTIVGDPTDDLSLLACFHPKEIVEAAIRGYTEMKRLPDNFFPRFYLHLLRNMIVKAVIRVGADYFQKTDDFFLIEAGSAGSSLEKITRDRIFLAHNMLKNKIEKLEL